MVGVESREGQVQVDAGVGGERPGVRAARLADVFLVACTRVLEPDLEHAHSESGENVARTVKASFVIHNLDFTMARLTLLLQ